MKISIAMATYNGAQYLQEQLQSFVDQTRHPDELIITDDCSTDQTESIVREFAKRAPFPVEFHRNEENLGYCGNFNAALIKTTGDLVFLSDQDDVWFPEKIEHMVGVAERNPQALVVMNDAAFTDGELNRVGLTKIGQIYSGGFSLASFVMGCCCAVRRELLSMCIPIPAGFKSHDSWLVWFADGLNAKVVDERVLQYYRRHESNESQFIANRTKKISRLQVFFSRLKRVFENDSSQLVQQKVELLSLFCAGVQCVIKTGPEKYRAQLKTIVNDTEIIIKTERNRALIREKWLLPRAMSVMKLMAEGGYKNTNGASAILRDLVGI